MFTKLEHRTDLTTRELAYRHELTEKILELKEQRNATILVHNYQRDEIQDIADFSGDSLALAREAAKVEVDVIVFCGVHFMAETAAIINPGKTVLLPVKEAGCPMADMVTVEKLQRAKLEHPDAAVVSYVNSSAAIKAESDICCTSSNAIDVVNALEADKILFVPDMNLGRYIAQHTDKEVILWKGFCATHHRLHASEVLRCKENHPGAEVIVHPECRQEVVDIADAVCSTQGMFKHVGNSPVREFIICTEEGIVYNLKKMHPDCEFYVPSENLICANMKLTTLGWVLRALDNMQYEITVEEPIRDHARIAIERMLAI